MISKKFKPDYVLDGYMYFSPDVHKKYRYWKYLDENFNIQNSVYSKNYPALLGGWFITYDSMDDYAIYSFIDLNIPDEYVFGKMCEIKNGEVKYFTGQAFPYCDIMVTVFKDHVLKKYRNAMRRFQFKHAPHE